MSLRDLRLSLVLALVSTLLVGGCAASPTAASPTATPVADSTVASTSQPFTIMSKYTHPEILADVSWVVLHLDDPTVRIIDARAPFQGFLYEAGHIPGALFVNVFSDICCPSKIMDAQSFEKLMGKLGIGDDTTVVIYDTDGGLWAARVWWALRYYGHENAKMLNGGLQAWVQGGRSLEMEAPTTAPAVFHAEVQPQWLATMDEVRKAVKDPEIVILDALTRPNYTGDLIQYARPGHIATALSLPAPDTLDPVLRTVLRPGDLSRMIARLGLDPEKRVITYCGGGIYGAHTAFVLYLMGFDQVGLYDGSLMEWASDSSNPMEVEP
jgi:thiosulfate/3-mercaptopyruvate sulfurtransferase